MSFLMDASSFPYKHNQLFSFSLSKSCSIQILMQLDPTSAMFLEGMKTPPSGPFRG